MLPVTGPRAGRNRHDAESRLRGGSFNNNNDNLRCANDNNNDRNNSNDNIGLRCCGPLGPQELAGPKPGLRSRSPARHGAPACLRELQTIAPGSVAVGQRPEQRSTQTPAGRKRTSGLALPSLDKRDIVAR